MKRVMFLIFALFLVSALVACNSDVSSQSSSIDPVVAQVTVAPSPVQTCFGWRIHLVSLESKDQGDGWTTLRGLVAYENVSANSYELQDNLFDLNKPFMQAWAALRVTTTEGFSYPVSIATAQLYAPVGVSYLAFSHYMSYHYTYSNTLSAKVGSTTTGWRVDTACGSMDLVHPEIQYQFPVADHSKISGIGNPIDIGDATFTVDKVQKADDRDGNPQITVDYTLVNNSKGYGFTKSYMTSTVAQNGMEFGGDMIAFDVGPGQTRTGSFTITALGLQDVLLFMQLYDNYLRTDSVEVWLGSIR